MKITCSESIDMPTTILLQPCCRGLLGLAVARIYTVYVGGYFHHQLQYNNNDNCNNTDNITSCNSAIYLPAISEYAWQSKSSHRRCVEPLYQKHASALYKFPQPIKQDVWPECWTDMLTDGVQ